MTEPNEDQYGLEFHAGDPRHHRAYVGPPRDYDLVGGLQFTLLFQAGLRETHRLLDLGCGSLRAGRLLIPYLRPGHYYGVEPNKWLVEEGIAHELGEDIVRVKQPTFADMGDFSVGTLGVHFDFVIAHSIFSHTFPDLASHGMQSIRDSLAEHGVLIATYSPRGTHQPGSGWLYPDSVAYTWDDWNALAVNAGFAIRRLSWPHPRQVWFACAEQDARVDEVAARVDRAAEPAID